MSLKYNKNIFIPACRGDQFHCDDGACIPSIYTCDGVADCDDRSDETDKAGCGE